MAGESGQEGQAVQGATAVSERPPGSIRPEYKNGIIPPDPDEVRRLNGESQARVEKKQLTGETPAEKKGWARTVAGSRITRGLAAAMGTIAGVGAPSTTNAPGVDDDPNPRAGIEVTLDNPAGINLPGVLIPDAATPSNKPSPKESGLYQEQIPLTRFQIIENDNSTVQFSKEEVKVLKDHYERAVQYFQTRYGQNIIDKKIVFRKIDPLNKEGHALYTDTHIPVGSDGSTVEIRITQIFDADGKIISKAKRDISHEMSHFWVTHNIVLGRGENEQMRRMYKPLVEAIAELDAYNLDDTRDPSGIYDVGYFRTEGGREERQDGKIVTKGFSASTKEYYIVSAALSELESKYPNLPRTMVGTFKRRNQIDEGTSQRYSPGIAAIVDEVDRQYEEQGIPGFKQALANEPALRYKL